MKSTDLNARAQAFARSLSDLASAFLGRPHPFKAMVVANKATILAPEPLPISTGHRTLFSVVPFYKCIADSADRYLLVEESSIKVYAGAKAKSDPLWRFEYVHDQAPGLPASHLHVHAHRDQLTAAMAVAGADNAPRRQLQDPDDYLRGSRMAELHFPLGGHRFRPGLEDVLQMMHTEFGAMVGEEWPTALVNARADYRRHQTAAAVRDCPSEAVRVLTEMKYQVTPPPLGAAPDRDDRLTAF